MTRYLLAAIGILALLLTSTGYLLKSAWQGEAQAKSERDSYRLALADQTAEIKRQAGILAQRERERVAAQQAAQQWQQRWQARLKSDEDCKMWADRPLPQCVFDQLFPNAGKDRKNVP